MARRIVYYLAITLGLIAQIIIIDNQDQKLNPQVELEPKLTAMTVPLLENLPIPEPTYTPLPKGAFSAPHAKVARAERDQWVLEEDFVYVDSFGKEWVAPAGTITDGASIPQAFLSATGDRLDGDYLDAAVIHDAYCQTDNAFLDIYRTETWQYVHYMFYEALLTSGVPEQQAKIMYTAVYLGGPRWGEDVELNGAVVIGTKENGTSLSMTNSDFLVVEDAGPTAEELAEFEAMLSWIESENPTGEELRDRLENG